MTVIFIFYSHFIISAGIILPSTTTSPVFTKKDSKGSQRLHLGKECVCACVCVCTCLCVCVFKKRTIHSKKKKIET